MAHEIRIHGIIVNDGEQNGYSPSMLNDELGKASGNDLVVRLNSIGGNVYAGFQMYNSLREYAKLNNAKVTTRGEGNCASIATVIFLAGDERILTKNTEPFVHDVLIEKTSGNANELRETANAMDMINKLIAEHYARHTDLSVEEALILMDNETSLTPDECVQLKFATKVEKAHRTMQLQNIINKQVNTNNMANNEKVSSIDELWGKISSALNGFKKEETKKIQNKIVFDANQTEVDFYELGEDEVIEVGAKATIDGKPADGDVLMADGNTFVFSNGELIEIKEAEEDANDEDSRIAELEAELASLKASKESELNAIQEENQTLQNKVTELEAVVNKIKALESEFKNEKKTPPRKEESKVTTSDLVAQFKQNKFKSK